MENDMGYSRYKITLDEYMDSDQFNYLGDLVTSIIDKSMGTKNKSDLYDKNNTSYDTIDIEYYSSYTGDIGAKIKLTCTNGHTIIDVITREETLVEIICFGIYSKHSIKNRLCGGYINIQTRKLDNMQLLNYVYGKRGKNKCLWGGQ